MHDYHDGFTFVDGDRTFTCQAEPLRPGQPETWWWFEVSTERHQRHAPFRLEPDDTRESVQARVVAFYDDLLERRAAPARKWWSRKQSPDDAQPEQDVAQPVKAPMMSSVQQAQ
ncbi:MAG TPA: hypothetical protein VGE02_08855 [Gemmatimonadales bacterium]